MACSNFWKIDKIDKLFICLLLIFICLFEFFTTFVFADELEVVDVSTADNIVNTTLISGLVASSNSNVFSRGAQGLDYFLAEKGKKYTIKMLQNVGVSRIVVVSSSVPAINGTYEVLYTDLQQNGDSFVYSPSVDTYISISTNLPSDYYEVTYEFLDNQTSVINSLVDNVGLSQLWGIFDISVNFILVVVLFAIGIYIIFSFIKKGSKGKSGF